MIGLVARRAAGSEIRPAIIGRPAGLPYLPALTGLDRSAHGGEMQRTPFHVDEVFEMAEQIERNGGTSTAAPSTS